MQKFSLKKELAKKENKKQILENVKEKLEKDKTMSLSIKEASAASVMSGFGDSYINPFALAINSNHAQIGFLSSFPGLIAPISQIFGSRLMEKYPRRKIMFNFVFFQALMWLPILILSLLFWKNFLASYLPVFLIVFYTIYAVLGSIAAPAWFSLIGDIVPEKIRGKYFSKRNRIATAVVLLTTLIAAFLLDFFKTKGFLLIGFSLLFSLAFIFRLISANLLKKHYEPKFKLEKGYYFTIFQFIKKSPYNNFGKFCIYLALMYLAVTIAGPFFSVYMLKDLNFSYITFTLVNISASLSVIIFSPLIGKFSDKYGNRELLRFSSILVCFLPILWLFSSSPIYLILVPQLLSGLGWAAFNLAVTNFIYDSVSIQRRALCVSYLNILVGIGVFLGSGLGGLIAEYLPITFMKPLLFLFLLSGITRFIFFFIVMPKIKEVKQVEKPRANPLLYFKDMIPARIPIKHAVIEAVDGISKIKKVRVFGF